MDRKPIFDAVRTLLGRGFSQSEVDLLDRAIDRAEGKPVSPAPARSHARKLGAGGAQLIKKWEGCEKRRADGRFDAYPDPGSADGRPWTIGWGSTGSDIGQGVIWTQAQCDDRFDRDVQRYIDEVAKVVGSSATSQNQFDALVSFHYNTGKIASATLTRLHKQGRFSDAAREFGKWVHNDGKVMRGLVNRRREEAALYAKP